MKKKGQVKLGDMKELLTITMGFEPLDDELEYFYQRSGKESLENNLSFEELVSILNKVRDELNETAKKSVNYKSYGAYTFDCIWKNGIKIKKIRFNSICLGLGLIKSDVNANEILKISSQKNSLWKKSFIIIFLLFFLSIFYP